MDGKAFLIIKEFILLLFEKESKRVDGRFEALDKAVTKAEEATEKRFESVNEFRAQLNDQTRTFIPRNELEEKLKYIKEIALKSGSRVSTMEDIKKGSHMTWVYAITAINTILAIAALVVAIIRTAGA